MGRCGQALSPGDAGIMAEGPVTPSRATGPPQCVVPILFFAPESKVWGWEVLSVFRVSWGRAAPERWQGEERNARSFQKLYFLWPVPVPILMSTSPLPAPPGCSPSAVPQSPVDGVLDARHQGIPSPPFLLVKEYLR